MLGFWMPGSIVDHLFVGFRWNIGEDNKEMIVILLFGLNLLVELMGMMSE